LDAYNALGLAKARGARFLLASSSEVYGDPLVHPQHEDYRGNVDQVGVRGVYDEARRYAEAITMAYHRHHRVGTRITRVFNTYGPTMRPDDGRIVPSFACRALAGEPLVVHGDGSQTRSIQYVDDLMDGLLRLMESDETRPINLGNPVEMTVLRIAETVLELSGSKSPISFGPLPPGDPKRRCPDISRARESLGWEPRVTARERLLKTLTWFADRPARPEQPVSGR
jgi:dTDP-glucose 4,6-dehydratase